MRKYFIDDEPVSEEKFNTELENTIKDYITDHYDDLLDEAYPPYKIEYATFLASEVLKKLDPIMYRLGVNDNVSTELEDAWYYLDRDGEFEVDTTDFRIEDDE